jgi:zinc finger protein
MVQMGDKSPLTCPGCGVGELRINTDETTIPHFGKVVISTILCSGCGYRSTDVMPVEDRPPARFKVQIEIEEDLNIRVIRSSTSTLIIPEMGVTIQPGTAQEGYVTNIQGVLIRVQEILHQVKRDLSNRSEEFIDVELRLEKATSLIERIERAVDGNIQADGPFTVILEDPQGNSALVEANGKVVKDELTEEEVLSLTRSLYQ